MSQSMVHVSHLTKSYGPRTAIQDLSFDINRGEIVGFLGPNGAGKSTTMKILTGFMPATSGKVTVGGHDVFKKPIEVKKRVGYLPETPPVYFEMVVRDYVEYAAKLHDVPSQKLRAAVDSAIDRTGLGHVRGRIIGNLSKGYRQRVGLAQAIVHNPDVLILDEPTVGLDPVQIIEIRELIKSFAGDHTVILSSHILPEVTATCQRVIIINKGTIVAQDNLDQLTRRLKKTQNLSLLVKSVTDSGLAALKGIAGVATFQVQGQKIMMELTPDAAEIRDVIAETAIKTGMGLLEFSSEKLSLEEIFLQLTTQENLQS